MERNGWVALMADTLTCEIMDVMSGIRLSRCRDPAPDGTAMSSVCAYVRGRHFDMQLRFQAEPKMFWRLARNMIGGEPESAEEVSDYASEFFNVLCGRFVSELCRVTRAPARFTPPQYNPEPAPFEKRADMRTLHFVSEECERAQFSWSAPLICGENTDKERIL